jgi:predicted metal-binding protein
MKGCFIIKHGLNYKIEMILKINPQELSFLNAEKLCRAAYPNHRKGCPNYHKKEGCPPNLLSLENVVDFKKDVYLIYTDFDIGKHAERMKELHSNWTERQLYCCLYWQPKARKAQRAEELRCKNEKDISLVLRSPEAHGVNVHSLMKKVGVNLEWPPRKITRIVSLGGTKS